MQKSISREAGRDVLAGLIFIAIAAGFAVAGFQYDLGTAFRMGPGFIPVTLAIILAVLGVVVIVLGLLNGTSTDNRPVPWVSILLICAAFLVFGYGARTLGLVPIVFICTLIAAFASDRNTLLSSLVLAVVMTVLCFVVFKLGLGVSLPTFGALFGT